MNRELEANARALAGIKGYVTNLAACPDGTPVTGEFVIGACHQLFEIERSFRMSKSDLQARPACHRKRDSIEAHLTIVFAALAVSRWIENQAGWSIRKFVRTARRYRTIEIQAGPHAITAAHPIPGDLRQALDCALPVVVTTAPEATDASGVPVQCVPGLSGGTPDHNAAALAGHTVVHLHGGLTPAASDGWAENLSAPGQDAVFHYPMGQRAALLWYHDHVMGVTRFGVYAGLAGLWIIRDQRATSACPRGRRSRCRCSFRTAISAWMRPGG